MRDVFFGTICLSLAFLSGGHQNWNGCILFSFIFGFLFLSSRHNIVLLLQLHSHMTRKYSYYKEVKIKNKNTSPPKINVPAKITLELIGLGKISVCIHARFISLSMVILCEIPAFWVWDGNYSYLLLCHFYLLTTPLACFQSLLMPLLTVRSLGRRWPSALTGSLCLGVLTDHSLQVLNRWIIIQLHALGF